MNLNGIIANEIRSISKEIRGESIFWYLKTKQLLCFVQIRIKWIVESIYAINYNDKRRFDQK